MAKVTKSTVPVIRTNHVLADFLKEQEQSVDSPATTEAGQKVEVVPTIPTIGKAGESATKEQADSLTSPEPTPVEERATREPEASASTESDAVSVSVDRVTKPVLPVASDTPVTKKGKHKGESSLSGKTYSEVFFKKPVKTEEADAESDFKLIRISEDSHWVLTFLVGAARRLGNKLTLGDLIENLLANHREVYKGEIDEIMNQWKTRRKIS